MVGTASRDFLSSQIFTRNDDITTLVAPHTISCSSQIILGIFLPDTRPHVAWLCIKACLLIGRMHCVQQLFNYVRPGYPQWIIAPAPAPKHGLPGAPICHPDIGDRSSRHAKWRSEHLKRACARWPANVGHGNVISQQGFPKLIRSSGLGQVALVPGKGRARARNLRPVRVKSLGPFLANLATSIGPDFSRGTRTCSSSFFSGWWGETG